MSWTDIAVHVLGGLATFFAGWAFAMHLVRKCLNVKHIDGFKRDTDLLKEELERCTTYSTQPLVKVMSEAFNFNGEYVSVQISRVLGGGRVVVTVSPLLPLYNSPRGVLGANNTIEVFVSDLWLWHWRNRFRGSPEARAGIKDPDSCRRIWDAVQVFIAKAQARQREKEQLARQEKEDEAWRAIADVMNDGPSDNLGLHIIAARNTVHYMKHVLRSTLASQYSDVTFDPVQREFAVKDRTTGEIVSHLAWRDVTAWLQGAAELHDSRTGELVIRNYAKTDREEPTIDLEEHRHRHGEEGETTGPVATVRGIQTTHGVEWSVTGDVNVKGNTITLSGDKAVTIELPQGHWCAGECRDINAPPPGVMNDFYTYCSWLIIMLELKLKRLFGERARWSTGGGCFILPLPGNPHVRLAAVSLWEAGGRIETLSGISAEFNRGLARKVADMALILRWRYGWVTYVKEDNLAQLYMKNSFGEDEALDMTDVATETMKIREACGKDLTFE